MASGALVSALRDEQFTAMGSAVAKMTAATTLAKAARAALEACTEGLSADGGAVWLCGSAGDEQLLAERGSCDPADRLRATMPSATAAETGKSGRGDGFVTLRACASLEGGGAVAIGACFREPGRSELLQRLDVLTGILAAAVDRVLRHESDRRIGLELQERLLPTLAPLPRGDAAARYLPAGEGAHVGGDWYDVVVPDDGRTVLVLGDVAGHSVESAVQMCEARTALRSHLLEGLSASAALARVNRLMLDRRSFATCCCVELDDGGLRIVSAGHPPPLAVDGRGSAQVLPVRPGPPLGAIPGAQFPTRAAAVPADAALVLYSDGLVEDGSEPITDGIERLRTAAARSDTVEVEALATHLVGLAGSPEGLRDDVAVLVFRHGGRPDSKLAS